MRATAFHSWQFSGKGPTKQGAQKSHQRSQKSGDDVKKGVRIALEALNRFESYFVNTMDALADYLDEVDHPNVTGMYDSFHSN